MVIKGPLTINKEFTDGIPNITIKAYVDCK